MKFLMLLGLVFYVGCDMPPDPEKNMSDEEYREYLDSKKSSNK